MIVKVKLGPGLGSNVTGPFTIYSSDPNDAPRTGILLTTLINEGYNYPVISDETAYIYIKNEGTYCGENHFVQVPITQGGTSMDMSGVITMGTTNAVADGYNPSGGSAGIGNTSVAGRMYNIIEYPLSIAIATATVVSNVIASDYTGIIIENLNGSGISIISAWLNGVSLGVPLPIDEQETWESGPINETGVITVSVIGATGNLSAEGTDPAIVDCVEVTGNGTYSINAQNNAVFTHNGANRLVTIRAAAGACV